MPRVVWLTDIHLNFASRERIEWFLDDVRQRAPSAVLLSGDISESRFLVRDLELLSERLECPLYFVLGNHDFYFGSIVEVRQAVTGLCAARPRLRYLSTCEPIALTDEVGLVGHDGWADGRLGNYERSYVMMNDYKLIRELARFGKAERLAVLQAYGDAAAQHIERVLSAAVDCFPRVYLVTHVPPWREACWHEGRLSDDEWAPHFTCKAMGDVILDLMRRRPDRELVVLCGHTHGAGETWPLPNVRAITGGAVYGQPDVTHEFEL